MPHLIPSLPLAVAEAARELALCEERGERIEDVLVRQSKGSVSIATDSAHDDPIAVFAFTDEAPQP